MSKKEIKLKDVVLESGLEVKPIYGPEDLADVPVIVGGNIPQRDIEKLKTLGVAGVFPTATPFEDIVRSIREKVGGGQ